MIGETKMRGSAGCRRVIERDATRRTLKRARLLDLNHEPSLACDDLDALRLVRDGF